MDLRIMTEPQQGATYDQLLALAREAERCGFGGFFRSDHYLRIGAGDPGPGSTDAWTTLAGLARDTSTIRLGTLVTAATFRHPGALAVQVATVDAMSGGRVELGLGAGWHPDEHTAFGIPFPPTAERFERLEEQFTILTGLWRTPDGQTFSHDGRHYTLTGAPPLPRPVQRPHPPLIVGGRGARKTPALAARFADEYNAVFQPDAETAACFARVRAACEAAGRDPGELVYSVARTLVCGRDEAEVTRRLSRQHYPRERLLGEQHGVVGTPEQVVEQITALRALGVQRLYLQLLDHTDPDHVALVGEEVLPHVR